MELWITWKVHLSQALQPDFRLQLYLISIVIQCSFYLHPIFSKKWSLISLNFQMFFNNLLTFWHVFFLSSVTGKGKLSPRKKRDQVIDLSSAVDGPKKNCNDKKVKSKLTSILKKNLWVYSFWHFSQVGKRQVCHCILQKHLFCSKCILSTSVMSSYILLRSTSKELSSWCGEKRGQNYGSLQKQGVWNIRYNKANVFYSTESSLLSLALLRNFNIKTLSSREEVDALIKTCLIYEKASWWMWEMQWCNKCNSLILIVVGFSSTLSSSFCQKD